MPRQAGAKTPTESHRAPPRRIAIVTPRRLLVVLLLAYQTLAAVGFAGVTRYRVPWDFTLALCAAPALLALARRLPRLVARPA